MCAALSAASGVAPIACVEGLCRGDQSDRELGVVALQRDLAEALEAGGDPGTVARLPLQAEALLEQRLRSVMLASLERQRGEIGRR